MTIDVVYFPIYADSFMVVVSRNIGDILLRGFFEQFAFFLSFGELPRVFGGVKPTPIIV
jgi:hypothetical protein